MTQLDYTGPGVVLRFGELFLKGRNRYLFEQALEHNVKRAVAHREDVTVLRKHGRIFVLGANDAALLSTLEQVFGIASLSPAVFCEKDLDAVTKVALRLAAKQRYNVKTFRISARRSDKNFSFSSSDLGRIVGAAVASSTGFGVDLEDYDLKIGIEIGVDWTFVWSTEIRGAGGLPAGTSGRMVLLLSGGIDSPVAGHLMQKRGVELIPVYFHSFPYTSDGAMDKVIQLARVLSSRQQTTRIYTVPFTAVQELFRDGADPRFLVILYRRAMIRIAEMLAQREKVQGLITGESLGQVASQTLANLAAIEDAATMPILRPLIGLDKAETITLAKRIGTYDISILPHDDCCSLFVPKHPETKASIKHLRSVESRIDWASHIQTAFEAAQIEKL